MYFVIYIVSADEFAVIPENWIWEFAPQKEKFLNTGLNRNQKHVCFWTDSPAARNPNGTIKLDFDPRFSHYFNIGFNNSFPAEGCYLCLIVRANEKFDEAMQYCRKRRFPPPIYNQIRVLQRPVPQIPLVKSRIRVARRLRANSLPAHIVSGGSPIQLQGQSNMQTPSRLASRLPSTLISTGGNSPVKPVLSPNQGTHITKNTKPNLVAVTQAGAIGNLPIVSKQSWKVAWGKAQARAQEVLDNARQSKKECAQGKPKVQMASQVASTLASTYNNDSATSVPLLHQGLHQENTKIDTKTNTLAATQIKAEENLPILSRIVSKQSLKTSLKTALNCAVSPTQLQGQSNMQTLSGDDSSRDNIRTDDDLKIEPVYGFYGINAGEIDSLIQRPQTYLYEDVEMFFTTFPVPFNATKHDLFKRQGDIFSGNIAFNQTRNGRIYLIGDRYFEIQQKVIETLTHWNRNFPESLPIDKRFVHVLLLILASKEEIAAINIPEEIITFLEELIQQRSNDILRVSAVRQMITEICEQKKPKPGF